MPSRPRLCLILLSLACATDAAAQILNFEMRELHPEINPVARYVYGACSACTLAQYADIPTPPGWQKAPARVGAWSSGSFVSPTPPPGAAPAVDFVPGIPGAEFQFIAEVLEGSVVGFDPSVGAMAVARVRRTTVHTYDAGSVIHEVSDAGGNRYVLLTFDHALAESTYDLLSVDSLASLPLPPGWTHESRVLAAPLVNDSGGIATVFALGGIATYQRYATVPAAIPVATSRLLLSTPRSRPESNRLSVRARDAAIDVAAAGSSADPRCGAGDGGELRLIGRATGKAWLQRLPCEGWEALGRDDAPRGYHYRDPTGALGACDAVRLREGSVSLRCRGRSAPLAYPLEPGTAEAPMRFELQIGDQTHCGELGGAVLRDGSDGRRYLAARAPAPGRCP